MNVYLPNSRLPSAYQEVEYIGSSGTQYINTGYVLTSNPGFDMDFEFVGGDSNSWIPICGSRNDGSGTNTGNFGMYINSSSLYVTPNYAGFDPGTSSGVTISKNTKYNIIEDAGKFYFDGVYKSSASTTNTYVSNVDRNFLIFAMNNYDGTVQIRGCMMKLYGCKLYNNGTLVRNFIPCYRKSDSVIGLYDLVNNQFYTNSGTGTFSKGNDVTMTELKNAYIGGYVEETYTIPSMSNSSGTRQNSFLLISKNGYTIKKVIMETTGNPNPSSNYGTYDLGLQNNSNTYGNGDIYVYAGQIGLNNNAKISYKFSSSSTGVDARVNLSGLNHTGSNLTKFSFDSNNGNANINGTNNEYTISGTEKTIVQQILQSATVYAYISIVRATTTATTVTVIYEPN